jgi:undecaprenyl diphosphate synthase
MVIWKVLSRSSASRLEEEEVTRLGALLDPERMPRHVAVIMDGNGRWARKRMLPRVAGHRVGIDSVREIVRSSSELGIGHLTLYAFSTENWGRPRAEVDTLMGLIQEFIERELDELHENGVRFQVLGRREDLPRAVEASLHRAEQRTASNSGLHFNVAVSYSGRVELEDALRAIADEVAAGRIDPAEVGAGTIERYLYTAGQPDPDLVIRTSGELRLSNFLLWQIAYAEIYFTNTLWPDFRKKEYLEALLTFQQRQRRFGTVAG